MKVGVLDRLSTASVTGTSSRMNRQRPSIFDLVLVVYITHTLITMAVYSVTRRPDKARNSRAFWLLVRQNKRCPAFPVFVSLFSFPNQASGERVRTRFMKLIKKACFYHIQFVNNKIVMSHLLIVKKNPQPCRVSGFLTQMSGQTGCSGDVATLAVYEPVFPPRTRLVVLILLQK